MNQPSFEELRRDLERLFGYPRGVFDPLSPFLRDAERINRALGEGFVLLQDVLGPQQLLDRLSEVPREVFELPRRELRIWEIARPWLDGMRRH